MPDDQFELMRRILAAPSPIGLESAMTFGVIQPHFESFMPGTWSRPPLPRQRRHRARLPPRRHERFSIMLVGHADKIRLQVRKIGSDGKIWVNSDSFLPATLIGHEVRLFSEDPEEPGRYRSLDGGTIEAMGAIHFSDPAQRTGDKGIRPNSLYLDLQIHGKNKADQVKRLGIKPGDSLILNRPIKRGFSPDTFYGAYLDNGLGSFVTAEVARLVAEAGGTDNVRVLFAIASHEEIGRFGSRVMAGRFEPDVLIGIDVSHDFDAAPGIEDRNMSPLAMGAGYTLASGSVISEWLNSYIKRVTAKAGIPVQLVPKGDDTGTDAMAAAFASVDAAVTSIGFPIRNMHTISESGHTGDVLAAVHAMVAVIRALDAEGGSGEALRDVLRDGHARLDEATALMHAGFERIEPADRGRGGIDPDP